MFHLPSITWMGTGHFQERGSLSWWDVAPFGIQQEGCMQGWLGHPRDSEGSSEFTTTLG